MCLDSVLSCWCYSAGTGLKVQEKDDHSPELKLSGYNSGLIVAQDVQKGTLYLTKLGHRKHEVANNFKDSLTCCLFNLNEVNVCLVIFIYSYKMQIKNTHGLFIAPPNPVV